MAAMTYYVALAFTQPESDVEVWRRDAGDWRKLRSEQVRRPINVDRPLVPFLHRLRLTLLSGHIGRSIVLDYLFKDLLFFRLKVCKDIPIKSIDGLWLSRNCVGP